MTDEQLQKAIEKYVTIIVGDGVKLEHHQKFFYEKLTSVAIKLMFIQTERAGLVSKEDASMIPLIIEDKFVRNYLWERGLVAVEDRCMRSHPHEKMDEYCQHKTNLARLMNKEAQQAEPVATNDTSQERVDETAKQRHEPVAWVSAEELLVMKGNALAGAKDWRINVGLVKQDGDVGLYTSPPQRQWVGLTDEEQNEILLDAIRHKWLDRLIVKQIEAKLKEKNNV